MIYEANHESHIEKLEEFFNKKRVYQAEMKSIQKLARKSKVRRPALIINCRFFVGFLRSGKPCQMCPSA